MVLVAAYGFGAGSGSTIADDSGNGHTLTVGSGSYTASGNTGPGFQNISNTATTGASGNVGTVTGTNCSLMAWVKPSVLTANESYLICGSLASDASSYFVLWTQRGDFGTHNVLQGNARLGGGPVAISGTALTVGTWAHVAMTYDGTTLKLFLNGSLVTSLANTNTISNAATFYIAGHDQEGRAGVTVDDVRYFNSDESANIATWMNTPVGGGGSDFTDAGTATITLGVTGVGSRRATASGTAGLTLAATGAAAAERTAAGTAGLTLAATGAGSRIATDAGIAGLLLGADGTALRRATDAGIAGLVLGGDGAALRIATADGTGALELLATGSVESGENVDAGTALLTLDATGTYTAIRGAAGAAVVELGAAGVHATRRAAAGAAVLGLLATGTTPGDTVHTAAEPRLTVLPNLATLTIQLGTGTLTIDQGGTA